MVGNLIDVPHARRSASASSFITSGYLGGPVAWSMYMATHMLAVASTTVARLLLLLFILLQIKPVREP